MFGLSFWRAGGRIVFVTGDIRGGVFEAKKMIRKTLKATQLATYSVDLPDLNKQGMPSPTGTGFFVSTDGWFVTAAHVITENNKSDGLVRTDIDKAWLMKESRPGIRGTGMCQAVRFEYINPGTDFALLKVDFSANANKEYLKDRTGFPYLEVSSRELEEGEPVYAFGYPLSSSTLLKHDSQITVGFASHCPRITSAIVASTIEKTSFVSSSGDPRVYVLDKALNYGNSGGPIIGSETGKVYAFCSRFQPMGIPQKHQADAAGNPPFIMVPSLYGVVSSLSNPNILAELSKRGVSISSS